jgi:hypothetical protein
VSAQVLAPAAIAKHLFDTPLHCLPQVPEMTPQEHGRLWYDFIVAFARQLLLISGGGAAGAAATQRLVRSRSCASFS